MRPHPSDTSFEILPLAPEHDRRGFECGKPSLDAYLGTQAGQDARRRASGVFVLVDAAAPTAIQGYYTLSAAGLAPGEVPESARAKLPRYPQIAATLIGRLAVSRSRQGQGLGALLLVDALRRTHASAATIGSVMVIVDALDERAAAFYASFGFLRFPDSPRLMLPMRSVAQLGEGDRREGDNP